ncbi:MAG: copper amine oxidase [Monoraphidium minutum]|nr:MAG: copper amine oxidase [Monoraphidium minutum]
MEQTSPCGGARACPQPGAQEPAAPHPLDQLTPAEVSRAAAAARAVPGALRFNTIMLQEPPKRQLIDWYNGRGPEPPRRGVVWVLNPPHGKLFEAVVDLPPAGGPDTVLEWTLMDGLQPTATPDDCTLAEEIILKDKRVMAMVAERYGITDPALIVFDPWTLHGTPAGYEGRRLMQGFLYVRTSPDDNEYAHPLDLLPLVDLNLGQVINIECYDKPATMPPLQVNYHADLANATTGGGWRTDVRPINITQPEGPSFTIEGSLVKWQKWTLRVGFNPREGLVLHNVGWEENGAVRPILHRASLVEMAVPYGDPNQPYVRKCAFDIGDYGMGFTANSLELGCDCVGHIKYFDGVVNNAKGEPLTIRNAVCLHEEDAGMLWKHTDTRLNRVEVRRNRRLVVSQVSTFANYEYALYWNFYIDGTMSLEMKLTGILSTSYRPLDQAPGNVPFGVDVAPGVIATNHQHLFCVRLDPSLDCNEGGRDLVVTEVNADMLPLGPKNPHGNAFQVSETPLLSVHQAMRVAAPERSRAWKIKNPSVINPITGQPVGFKLQPTSSTPMLMQPESLVAKRAFFATKHLFVTPHAEGQLYPAGDHVVQSEDCLGLKLWTKEDKPLKGRDPVVWHSFGITHLPRLEDFPIMPAEVVGFTLKPWGFHKWNPTLDLPPTRNAASRQELERAAAGPALPRPRM